MNRPMLAAAVLALAAIAACSMPTPDRSNPLTGGGGDVFEEAPTFEAATTEGEGDGVVELPADATQAIVTASHDGEHYFSISALDESNADAGQLVNAIGSYAGSTLLGASQTGEPVRLEVTADGAWTITVAPIADAAALPEGGTGDGVYRYDGDAGTWAVVHSGEHYFQLAYYTDAALSLSILANEVGAYDGSVAVTDGPALVVVQADGDWTITPA